MTKSLKKTNVFVWMAVIQLSNYPLNPAINVTQNVTIPSHIVLKPESFCKKRWNRKFIERMKNETMLTIDEGWSIRNGRNIYKLNNKFRVQQFISGVKWKFVQYHLFWSCLLCLLSFISIFVSIFILSAFYFCICTLINDNVYILTH